MPALTSYSPYETLVFFQNVAYYGVDKISLQNISTTLNQNQLIRESEDYDASKFSPDALHHLYDRVVNAHQDEISNGINGDLGSTNGNPLKRKLSVSPAPSNGGDELFLQQHINHLYGKFKEETIRELRQQEEDYRRIQDEIHNLESQIKAEEVQGSQKPIIAGSNAETVSPPAIVHTERSDPVSAQLHTDLEAANHDIKSGSQPAQPQVQHQPPPLMTQPYEGNQASPLPDQRASTPKSSSGTPLPRHVQPPPLPSSASHPSPGPYNRTLPPPSPQRNSYGPLPPPPHNYPNHPQNQPPPHMLPPIHGLQRMPSHEGYPPRAPNQGRGSPMPQHPPSGYPQYPPYQQWHSPGPQQYPQPIYPPQQHYPTQIPGRYPQVHTPNQPTYQPYPHTAPIPYQNQPSQPHRRGPPVPQYHQYPASSSNTPLSRPDSRTAIFRSGGSTPWKKRAIPPGFRPRSPSRLEREISPISDTGSPPPEVARSKPEKFVKRESTTGQNTSLREKSTTPAAHPSRSQSVLSNASEVPNPPKRKVGRPPKAKPEPPTTPAPLTSDSEQPQRSSGRRGRPRTNTVTTKPDLQRTTTTAKRKRDAPSESPAPRSLSMSQTGPTSVPRTTVQIHDPNLVIVSKTFGRTSQLLLNEITSHKVAGIFAKPLSEREAPGYKSRVLRSQDLKSIKAAISKGSRAAIAAIEKLESDEQDGDKDSGVKGDDLNAATPTLQSTGLSNNAGTSIGERPIGNGFYYVHATEDLLPPKGIVNSAQLEMELVRMFANAVMFNPLPTSERGFGRSLRLRKRGGELPQYGARTTKSESPEDNEASTDDNEREESEPVTIATSTSETESSAAGADEGGIIANTREMFNDVERLVSRWRELEGGSTAGWHASFSTPMTSSAAGGVERHDSVSASSVAGEDDGDATPSASFAGSVRKRRKIGDR